MREIEKEKEFAQRISEHQLLLHKICRVYAFTEADRKDLFQEIVIQLWKAWPKFQGLSKFSTWLCRVAINTAITGLRKEKAFITSYEPSQLPELEDQKENEGKEEQLQQLYKAIAQLNEIDKAIVMLYMEDRSYDEMEDILGLTQGNLRVKMNRIKEKLRQLTKSY